MLSSSIYKNLLGNIIKRGKKVKAKLILNSSIEIVSSRLNSNSDILLQRLAQKIGSLVELRKIKIRKNVHIVPFPVKSYRRKFLFSKELVSYIFSDKKKTNSVEKLNFNIFSYLIKKGSNYNKKDATLKEVIINRSNIHYRW
jgi:ribosomal protein S7|uniref:Ribosomal protein S7 n=1 Tax=Ochromonas danica TaxID=2986 RepID=Q9G8Z4_OCHDN|nr:ribosomal protein S7 [Ochromonas danica]AAG18411.1 ribosomal protein S7 [Ochromonas danica]